MRAKRTVATSLSLCQDVKQNLEHMKRDVTISLHRMASQVTTLSNFFLSSTFLKELKPKLRHFTVLPSPLWLDS